MPSRGLPAVGAVLVLGAAACSGNAEPRTLYFLHAEGVAHVSNGRTAEAQLIEGTIAYGGAQLSPEKPPKLRLHFKLGGRGQLFLGVGPYSGVGAYNGLQGVSAYLDGDEFRCYEGCRGCTVNIDDASDAAISGTLSCPSLSNCPTALLPRGEGEPACRNVSAVVIDLTGTFRLDQASFKIRDY